MLRWARLLLPPILLGSATLLACADVSDATQEADHTSGDFGGDAWRWADDTAEAFVAAAMNETEETETVQFLATDHPMATRLQFWLDAMDTVVRRIDPAKLANVPRPRIMLRWSSNINAWVRPVPTAWRVDVRTTPTTPGEPRTASHLTLSIDETVGWTGEAASARPPKPGAVEDLARFFNGSFSSCRLQPSVNGTTPELTFDDGCRTTGLDAASGYRANALQFDATSSFITITTTLIEKFAHEDQVITILAHELGHYYRSHLNLPSSHLNYFYSLEETGPTTPAPDPRFLEQTKKARAKLAGSMGGDFAEEKALMQSEHLGFYTTEQEADEIALEAAAAIGVAPTSGPDTFLTWLRLMEAREAPDSIKYADCAALRDAGWKDHDGNAVSVPVGGLGNPHHSLCFRVFNLTRELEAHHYTVAARPQPPGQPWSALVEHLATEYAGSPPDSGRPIVYGPGAFPPSWPRF